MNRFGLAMCAAIALATQGVDVLAAPWPKATDVTNAPCVQALEIARTAFESDAVHLYAPPEIPPDLDSALVLEPVALDISDGNALEADQEVFDKLPIGQKPPRSVYWQRAATHGLRLAVAERPVGWRGDMYSLFAVDAAVPSEKFLAELRRTDGASKFSPLVSDSWRPPLILREKKSGDAWVIDVGQPHRFLAEWEIHAVGPRGVERRCAIQFRPEVQQATSLLPQPVRKLARLLDQTMGPGVDEGTLQATAKLRLHVAHMWANAAMRPWATMAPYNTREEVNAGLKAWARSGAAHRQTYRSLQQQLPLARRSLAGYYRKTFDRTANDAALLSAYVLDAAVRSHYAFHSEAEGASSRRGNPAPNPWRKK